MNARLRAGVSGSGSVISSADSAATVGCALAAVATVASPAPARSAARPQSAADLVKVLESVTSGGGHPVMPEILLGGRPRLARALAFWAAAFIAVTIVARAAIIAIGLPDWVLPGAVVVMALGLPAILFTYFVHRGAHQALTMPMVTPGGGTMRHSSFTRLAVKVSPHVSWRRTTMGGVYALGVFAVLVVGFMVLRAFGIGPVGSLFARGALQKNERILVADFRNTARDTTLGPIVTEAFRTGLGQSQSMMVMPATALRDALRRMQRDVNTRVDASVAREIAIREGFGAVVTGVVRDVGDQLLHGIGKCAQVQRSTHPLRDGSPAPVTQGGREIQRLAHDLGIS